MKKILGTLAVLLIAAVTFAQTPITGTVTDEESKPLPGATVILKNGLREKTAFTDEAGSFRFDGVAGEQYRLTVTYVGMKTFEESFILSGEQTFRVVMKRLDYFLEPLELKAIRASDRAPFTKTDISGRELDKINLGQDIPFLLNQAPSVTVNSDAGNGVGYTYIHIRGTDASRINVTLNGIPYNDAESQGTYFVDLPDFTSSVSSVQIQRGVGTSTNGSAAFGATINLSTNEFHADPYAQADNSYGSFNTWKNTIRVGTGLIGQHFTVDARLSRITSDGYIDRAASNLQSYYISPAYTGRHTSVRLNLFSGKEKTYQAWYGVPQDSLSTHRTYNPAGTEKPGAPYDNQTDNYWQKHYQLFVNQQINPRLSFNVATFLTRGYGYYEEYKAGQAYADYGLADVVVGSDTLTSTDLVRQRWLDNYFYGQIFSLQYKYAKDEVTFGGSWSRYDGKHYGNITWSSNGGIAPGYEYYRYPALKTDNNIYLKWLHSLTNAWNLFGDLQYRNVRHNMDGFEGNGELIVHRRFNFFNPKLGASYMKNGYHAYISYALAHREPNRDDFQASPSEQPTYETLHDFEAGADRKTNRYNWGVTLFYMLYDNQLVLTGKINDVGSYTRVNVPNSYRAGVELQGSYVLNKSVNIGGNLSLSRNKISAFTEYIDNYDNYKQNVVEHNNTDISFSPSVIGGATLNLIPFKNAAINLSGKFVGRQYMDNTENQDRMLKGYYTQDARFAYTVHDFLFSEWNLALQVNNVFNKKYEPNGYTYPYIYGGELVNDNYYYPMAGTNFFVAIHVAL